MNNNSNNNYDVILVGGGIANILCAIKLAHTDLKVLLIEQGNSIDKRDCPKTKTGKCVNCKTCRITTGFGGAGFCSDCKLDYSSEVGGDVIHYIGRETFDQLLNDVSDIFTSFGADDSYVYNEEFANSLKYECSKYGMKLVKYPVRHLGTDGARVVMNNIYNYLNGADNITILCNTQVMDIDFANKIVYFASSDDDSAGHNYYSADYISIAVGRSGSEWLSNICKKQDVKVDAGSVDIGVRVECPRSVTDNITDNLYEMKIYYNSSTGNTCRTFCVNPGGYVVQEKWND